MITELQLIRHGFLIDTAPDKIKLFNHGKVQGVLSGGVFHFPTKGEWKQAKNISHLKHEYFKYTGEKLVDTVGENLPLLLQILNK